ncbi:hypothetical protein BHE74_00027862 [Ensete ventricosum]|nr:hypothetical protein BHE74_00027862 [Ensete ventricosum]
MMCHAIATVGLAHHPNGATSDANVATDPIFNRANVPHPWMSTWLSTWHGPKLSVSVWYRYRAKRSDIASIFLPARGDVPSPRAGAGDPRATARLRTVGEGDDGAWARPGARFSSSLLFFLFLFFFFFSFSPSIDPISPSIDRRQPKSTADGRFLAVPPGNGWSAYRQPGGPVCIARTGR